MAGAESASEFLALTLDVCGRETFIVSPTIAYQGRWPAR